MTCFGGGRSWRLHVHLRKNQPSSFPLFFCSPLTVVAGSSCSPLTLYFFNTQEMGSPHKFIKDITPTTKNWTAKVTVIEKQFPRKSHTIRKTFHKLVLSDVEGTRVQATIFEDDIDRFANTLRPLHSYYISNAAVSSIKEEHRTVNNEFQWIINARTPIAKVSEEEHSGINATLNVVPFSDLQKYINSTSHIDILAAVVDVFPEKEVTTKTGVTKVQELVVINNELKPMILTLWAGFIPNEGATIVENIKTWPIIIGKRLKVTPFNGMSLSTKPSSSFIINPFIPEAITLKNWLQENSETIEQIIATKSHTPARSVTTITAENITTIDKIPQIAIEGHSFCIHASAFISDHEQRFWYMGCNKCRKAINAEYGMRFNCINCKTENVIAEPRSRFTIQLKDSTGLMAATIYEAHAQRLFSINGMTLMQNTNEEGKVDMAFFDNASTKKEYFIQIKGTKFQGRYETTHYYMVTTVVDELQHN